MSDHNIRRDICNYVTDRGIISGIFKELPENNKKNISEHVSRQKIRTGNYEKLNMNG